MWLFSRTTLGIKQRWKDSIRPYDKLTESDRESVSICKAGVGNGEIHYKLHFKILHILHVVWTLYSLTERQSAETKKEIYRGGPPQYTVKKHHWIFT